MLLRVLIALTALKSVLVCFDRQELELRRNLFVLPCSFTRNHPSSTRSQSALRGCACRPDITGACSEQRTLPRQSPSASFRAIAAIYCRSGHRLHLCALLMPMVGAVDT